MWLKHKSRRGKAGGVKIAKSLSEVETYANELLGKQLVTHQTGPEGKEVKRLYIEQGCDIQKEYYVGFVIDRATDRITLMASEEGGTEIEEVVAKTPEKSLKKQSTQLLVYHLIKRVVLLSILIFQKNLLIKREILISLYNVFIEKDCSIVEINPLVTTGEGEVLALDAKINFDDNALFRHKDIQELRDLEEEDPKEIEASKYDLSYIALDGDIGCMVNGAGLAMATMDTINHFGGNPLTS